MAFNLNLALKKQNGKSGEKKGGKLVEDVRIFIVLLALVCVVLIVMSVFGVKSINKTIAEIDQQKTQYSTNQLAIANLKALQSKSSEYEALNEKYNELIPNTSLDQQKIMIEMETRCDNGNCMLTDIQFGESTSANGVKQVPVMLSITGSFNDIVKFCQDIVTDKEFMRIDSISMAGGTENASVKNSQNKKTAKVTVVKFAKGS